MLGLPRFNAFWFWVGFLVGLVFGLLARFFQELLQRFRATWHQRWSERREAAQHTWVQRWRSLLRVYLQSMHIAAPLFPLDAVLLPPRVVPLLPLPDLDEEEEDPRLSPLLTDTLPPALEPAAWETLFAWPALTLHEALRHRASLVVLGPLGSGKTVALVHTALQRMDADPQTLPLFFHASDLPWAQLSQASEEAPLWQPLLQALRPALGLESPREEQALAQWLEKALAQEGTLILVDGVDEIPPWKREPLWDWMRLMHQAYPQLQWVVALDEDGYGPLVQWGFHPVRMLPWDEVRVQRFLRRWHKAWHEQVAPHLEEKKGLTSGEAYLLAHWLRHENRLTWPLEFTLKAWGLWAGDVQGSHPVALVHAWVRRLVGDHAPAWERWARHWLHEAEAGEAEQLPAPLVRSSPNGRIRPVHPLLAAYAASLDPDESYWQEWFRQPEPWWEVRTVALAFWGRVRQETLHSLLTQWLQRARPPLYRAVWQAARVLYWSGTGARHDAVLRALTWLLQHQQAPLTVHLLAAWYLWALIGPGSRKIFRALLRHANATVRQAAVLACALTQDHTGLQPLLEHLERSEEWPGPLRRSVYLTLASLGQEASIRALVRVLLSTQNDAVRREIAEAIARDPHWNRQVLQEAAQDEDLLVRKAAAYALGHVPARWARELLETLAREDPEWLVRNAAEQVLEALQRPSPWAPRKLPPLHQEPWLVTFAHTRGLTLAPGRAAWLLVEQVLQQGEPEFQRRALRRLLFHPNVHWLPLLRRFLSATFPLADEAWHTLNHFAKAGLPVEAGRASS